MKVDVRLRGGQEKRDDLQNLGIALRVIEFRGIDEGHRFPLEGELVGNLDLGSTRLQGHSNPWVRTTCAIDKLEACRVSFGLLSPVALRLQSFCRFQLRP